MPRMRPSIVIGIGPQAQRTVKQFMNCVRVRQGKVAAILPLVFEFAPQASQFQRKSEGIQYLTLSSPRFQEEQEWPSWLPSEIAELSPAQRERTRAWMRAAVVQRADDLQEFLLESVPQLSSFAAVEELAAGDISLIGDARVNVVLIADLSDQLGGGIFVDVAYLTSYVCRQLGLSPLTTGLLYLPSSLSPAPAEEAIAYAALKELEHYVQTRAYSGDLVPDWALSEEFVPFEDGCYLLDNVNELGYTLPDPSQQLVVVSEWLYATILLDMAAALRERRSRRYATATLRGKSRIYEGLGMAVRYVPQALLVDWAASRLGADALQRILMAQADVDPEKRVRAFIERVGLRVGTLQDGLLAAGIQTPVEEALTAVYAAHLNQIESVARQALQTIRERYLPVLNLALEDAGQQFGREIADAMDREVQFTLEDFPVGGVQLAYHILDQVHDHVETFRSQVGQRVRTHRARLRRSLSTVSEAYYALRGASMSLPPWPIWALGALTWLVLPLLYGSLLFPQLALSLNPVWGVFALAFLWVGVAIVIGLAASRAVRQMRLVRARHVRMVRDRFELEREPLVNQVMEDVYGAAMDAAAAARSRLDLLAQQVQGVRDELREKQKEHARELVDLSSPGTFRSAVGPDEARHYLEQVVPDLDPLIRIWMQGAGPLSDWPQRIAQGEEALVPWLRAQLLLSGKRYFEQRLSNAALIDLMAQGLAEGELSVLLERLLADAFPLWNSDPASIRRAKTQRIVLLGGDTAAPAWAASIQPLLRRHPEVTTVDTGDPFTLVILHVHRGLPLFALRRIGEYRAHYIEALWRSRLPVHTMRLLALADDIMPAPRRKFAPASLFAVGLALGIITQDPSGRYLAPREGARAHRSSAQKERSVALMAADPSASREVERRLDALVARRGPKAIRAVLDEYLTSAPDPDDWEVKAILDFGRRAGLGT